jgi:hypothetical protein
MTKPISGSVAMFATQIARRRFPVRNALVGAAGVLRSPLWALRLGDEVRRLDLSPEMRAVRTSDVPTTVASCNTDTLVTQPKLARPRR